MKSVLVGVTLAFSLLNFASLASAAAQGPLQSIQNGNTFAIDGLSFYGSDSYYLESSTPAATAVLLASGSGFFYGVDCSSGTPGDFAQFFDAASPSGITTSTQGKALTPQVFLPVVLSSTNAQTYVGGVAKYVPVGGSKRFKHGVVGIKSGSAYYSCQPQILLDSVIQATPSTH